MTLALINELIGLPDLASEHGEMVDNMMEIVHIFMAVLGIGWSIFLVYVIWRFRQKKNPKADYHGVQGHTTTHIEIGVILVEAILLLGFAFPLWGKQVDGYPTGPDVVKVRAIGEKYQWNMHYPGADGVFGKTDPRDINVMNPFGMDFTDPNSRDDFFLNNELKLPVNRPAIIDIVSKDVIHNLHVVPMRIAQDAIPGVPAQMWFRPIKTGSWELICGQLCGPGHSSMKAYLTVVEDEEYVGWAKGESATALEASQAKDLAAAEAAKAELAAAQ